jgi:hypothetical protein
MANYDEYFQKILALINVRDKEGISHFFKQIAVEERNIFLKFLLGQLKSNLGISLTVKDLLQVLSLLPEQIVWYQNEKNVFSLDYLEELKYNILNSKYLGKNPLSYGFETTLGFSVTFRKNSHEDVIFKFPYLRQYLERIICNDCNVFLTNALVLGKGSVVKRHCDTTLRKYSPELILTPLRVSVLYIDVPEMSGGELLLYQGGKVITSIKPEINKLFHFNGSLFHEITEIHDIKSSDKSFRLSLVSEQYKVLDEALEKIPKILVSYLRKQNDQNRFSFSSIGKPLYSNKE